MGRLRESLLTVLLLITGAPLLSGQQQSREDESVFRLVQAERAEKTTEFGLEVRKVMGHARFFHNDTYLLCDSATWNVNAKYIECFGNVQVIQDKTLLKSEEMHYWIDESKALFRGGLVELFDKEHNTLRTERLTYITKDSLATFEYGGSLKDKDGNVIESNNGTYDGKEGLFTFEGDVELYMDSIEIKTWNLRYFNESERAYFGRDTWAWKDDGFLRADGGWYDKKEQRVHFSDHVFMFDPTYDAWADEVYYDKLSAAVDLYNNAQVTDTTNKSVYMGDHMQYLPANDSLTDRGILSGNPAVVYYGENENHEPDTMYVRADTIYVYAVPRCDVPDSEVKESEKRLEDLTYDALAKKREEDAVKREEERIQKMRQVGLLPPEWLEKAQQVARDSLAALSKLDSLVSIGAVDSLVASNMELRASKEAVDSLLKATIPPEDNAKGALDKKEPAAAQAAADTLPQPIDSTLLRYVIAWNDVRLFRSDIQVKCDSLVFTELDSIARLYGSPVLWNEVRNQLTADEMQLLMRNGALDRGSMISNAWMISEQDTLHYDQIKSTEMLGWFRDNHLYRFDALGGVSAIFYMTDEEVITTINVKESKSLTAALKDAKAQRLLYTDAIKSDVYPVGELPAEKQRLKDFKWRGDERPTCPEDITTRKVRESERDQYEGKPRPMYRETNKFFDNYMIKLFEELDARKKAEFERKQREKDSLALEEARAAIRDSLAREMALAMDEEGAEADSLAAPLDSLAAPLDSLTITAATDSLAAAVAAADSTAATPAVSIQDTVAARPVTAEPAVEKPALDKPSRKEEAGEAVAVASQETVEKSARLTRAEKRALRRAERQARREARRAARAARRAERLARKAAAKVPAPESI